jgi:hypothetical protein
LYALGTLALHQDKMPGWVIEAEGPFPVAVSHLAYGAPLGAVQRNVFHAFVGAVSQQAKEEFKYRDGGAIPEMLSSAAAGAIPRGEVSMEGTSDGNGLGSNLFGTLAMWLFGINILSMILFYLLFVGTSVCAFVYRYRDQRLLVVPLYFLVVTIMLLTPICTSAAGVSQTAIGGNRYFVLAALLPALHIFFEIIDHSRAKRSRRKVADVVALFIQAILLFGALLVRSAAGYLLGVLIIVFIYRLWSARREREQVVSLSRAGGAIGAAFAFWFAFVVLAFPAYVQSGRVFGNFWHRSVYSLSNHPDWPFGNLSEVYDCRKVFPGGLKAAVGDSVGPCIAAAYYLATENRGLTDRDIYDSAYENILRSAYFYIVIHYPRQIFQLYVDIKSRGIEETLIQAWNDLTQLSRAPVPVELFIILAAQAGLFLLFIVSAAAKPPTIPDRSLLIVPIFFLFSLAPRYVAWSSMVTGADMICLFYSCLILGALFLVRLSIGLIGRGSLVQAGNRNASHSLAAEDQPTE